jgi:hypothetical protein
LDSHQHNQRARRPVLSHGGVDGQPNDRLGREEQFHQFEHRRQILRGASTYTYSDSNSNSELYADSHANSQPFADSHANSEPFADTNSDCHGDSNAYFPWLVP